MAGKPASRSSFDNMSVLGESTPVYSIPGDGAGAYQLLHQLEVTSLFERTDVNSPATSDCRRPFKRPRGVEEQREDESTTKKFISEETVAAHLRHLNLASTASSPIVPSPSFEPSSRLAAPLLSSPDCSTLLASAAVSHPLNMKTVASCPRSLEMAREVAMLDEDGATNSARGIRSSHASHLVVSDVCMNQSQSTHSLCQSWLQVGGTGHVMDNSDEYQQSRSSPLHKRLACVLDEGEEGEEEEEVEREDYYQSSLAGPHLKRSKVDLRVKATATNLMNFDLPPDNPRTMTTIDSDASSQSSSCDSDMGSVNGGKRWEEVVLEDGSDSSDGGAEPGPERPLSLWVSPELQAISSNSRRVQDLLPPSILERYHTPKGMELVPWVGGPSAVLKVDERDHLSRNSNNHDNGDGFSNNSPQMESIDNHEDLQSVEQKWSGDNLNKDIDISMEP